MIISAKNVLAECHDAFLDARKSVFEGIALLWEISEKKLWEQGGYSGLGEYVEQELQLHPTQCSRYLKAYEHYVLKGKVDLARLNSVNPERLYTAMALSLVPEEQFLRAKTWTVREIKDELASKEGHDCLHEETVTICAACHKRV